MGGVRGVHTGYGSEPEREQRLDGERGGRRSDAGDAKRARQFTGMVAGWEDAGVFVVARWEFAGVPAFDGRRRGEEADDTFDRRGPVSVGAGWEVDCVHIGGVP